MVKRLFGTDGVRGVANADLTPELSFALGRAAGAVLAQRTGKERPRLLIGRDTRASGPMLEAALAAGANSAGVDCDLAGVLPTPGVAYLTRAKGYDGGVVISASHNPVEDNGIKFFSAGGFKLSDDEEAAIERAVHEILKGNDDLARPTGAGVGTRGRPGTRRRSTSPSSPGSSRWISQACGSQWTAGTGRRPGSLRRSSAAWAPRSPSTTPSPTASTSTWGAAPPAPRVICQAVKETGADLALPMTATPTGCWPWTNGASWSTAITSWRSWPRI